MNSDDIKESELHIAAERKASQYAPPPMVEPHMGGCWGAIFAVAVMVIFSAVAGFEAGVIPVFVTVAIFFALPALYFNSKEKQYRKAIKAELDRLKKQNSN